MALARGYDFLPGPTKNRPLAWSVEEDDGGSTLGRLLFVTVEPHSLGGGGGQHRGRQTGMWLQGLLLAEPPPRVVGHTCDRDEAAMEKGIEGGRQGEAFIKKVRMRK
jgi:hypothetical protein